MAVEPTTNIIDVNHYWQEQYMDVTTIFMPVARMRCAICPERAVARFSGTQAEPIGHAVRRDHHRERKPPGGLDRRLTRRGDIGVGPVISSPAPSWTGSSDMKRLSPTSVDLVRLLSQGR